MPNLGIFPIERDLVMDLSFPSETSTEWKLTGLSPPGRCGWGGREEEEGATATKDEDEDAGELDISDFVDFVETERRGGKEKQSTAKTVAKNISVK